MNATPSRSTDNPAEECRRAGDLHDLVDGAAPVGEASTGAFPAYLRRRYDRRRRVPDGFVVLGDAICSFNPLYAQGMSMAVRQAALLGEVLDRHGSDHVGAAFFRRSKPVIEAAWTVSTSADLGHPDVDESRTVKWRLLNTYFERLLRAAHHDSTVANEYLRVTAMVAPPRRVLHPRILLRVFRGNRDRAQALD